MCEALRIILEEATEKAHRADAIDYAKKMMVRGFSLQDVMEITGLSKEEIEEAMRDDLPAAV